MTTLKENFEKPIIVGLAAVLILVSAVCWIKILNDGHGNKNPAQTEETAVHKVKKNAMFLTSVFMMVAQYLPISDDE